MDHRTRTSDNITSYWSVQRVDHYVWDCDWSWLPWNQLILAMLLGLVLLPCLALYSYTGSLFVDPIESNRSNRSSRIDPIDPIESTDSIGSIGSIRLDRLERYDSIGSTKRLPV